MHKNLMKGLVLLVVPFLLITVACQKKAVQSTQPEAPAVEAVEEEAEAAPAEEMSQQEAVDEEALRAAAIAREKERERNLFVTEDVYFDFDDASLNATAQEALKRKAMWLRDNPMVSIVIEGHCDERGTTEYNLALGDRRAQSAKAFLVDLGINPSRLTTISYGEEMPVDSGHTEEAWAKNRRAHFSIE